MALTKYKLGDCVEPFIKKCGIPNLSVWDISGVNSDKEFFEPSKQAGEDTSNYKYVPPNYFACNLMHVGRDRVLPIGLNHTKKMKVVSPAYTVFKIKDGTPILKEYFFMMLKSDERDRYFWFHTDSSIRDGMSWDDFCDLDVDIPPRPIQQKYVDVYQSMLANQQSYERGLEDLKLTCDAYIENLSSCEYERIGLYIERNKKRNQEKNLRITDVKGFNSIGQFIEPMRLFSGDISAFKIIQKNDFVYNSRINSTISRLSIALNEDDDLLVSPAYESFYVSRTNELYPFFLYMILQRESFARKVLFNSFGSSTVVFGFDDLGEIEIPIPSIDRQKAIANIYKAYIERREINEKLKSQIKDICPILIKGSIEEAKKEA